MVSVCVPMLVDNDTINQDKMSCSVDSMFYNVGGPLSVIMQSVVREATGTRS